MFTNFIKLFKNNFNFIKVKIFVIIKLININLFFNFIFISLVLFCLIFNLEFLIDILYVYEVIFKFLSFIFIQYSLITYILLFILIINKFLRALWFKNNLELIFFNNQSYLNLLYNFKLINFSKVSITYYYYYLNCFFNSLFSNNIIFVTLNLLKNKLVQISWYPIFKRHSIFGFYRISRQRWVELKTEEVNYLKY